MLVGQVSSRGKQPLPPFLADLGLDTIGKKLKY